MNWKNWNIGKKLFSGFISLVFILIIVGGLGIYGVNEITKSTDQIKRTTPLMDGAMEMRVIGATLQQQIMEQLLAKDTKELEMVQSEIKQNIKDFTVFNNAMEKGGETDEGYIYASTDSRLISTLKETRQDFTKVFAPGILEIYEMQKQKIATRELAEATMRKFEKAFDQLFDDTEQFEATIKEGIQEKIAAGTTAEAIIKRDNTWADMSMEMKSTIGHMRIRIEEYAQELEAGSTAEIRNEFDKAKMEMDGWLNALFKGGKNAEGTIARLTDPRLKAMLNNYYKTYSETYLPLAMEFIGHQDKLAQIDAKEKELDEAIDNIGQQMQKSLLTIEDIAKETLAKAYADADNAKELAIFEAAAGMVIGVLVALFLSAIITRAISGPILNVVTTVNRVATEHDLTLKADVTSKDELGVMGTSFNEMMEELRKVFGVVSNAAHAVDDSSTQVAQLASRNRERAEEQMKRAQTSEKVITEMGNSAGQVSQAAGSQQEAARSTQKLLQELVLKMNTVSESAEAQNDEATKTIDRVTEMGETGAKVVSTAQEQGAMVEQVTSSIANMVNAVGNMQNAVAQAQQHGKASLDAAEEGANSVASTVKGMQAISESSEQISEIIGVITEIAEQTNLLALNAAVEAARAGAHGKGFAVVADEVGKLAQRSSEAAKEITQLIKDSTNNVADGVKLTDQSQQALAKIAEGGRVNMQAIEAISNTSDVLNTNTTEVKGQVEILNTLAQQIGTMAQEQGTRRKAAEEALQTLLEYSNSITVLVNESNESIQSMNKEMAGVVSRGDEMGELTGLQAQRSKAITKLSTESAAAASETVAGAGNVVNITQSLREQSENLTAQVQQFKV
ncbi:MAG: methyl-accepting chemotaxis protein [Gammaproteobacteria bacterium]|nr:methyl-accepting chemotaxis protein [Gammaproteobacteria bacterium]